MRRQRRRRRHRSRLLRKRLQEDHLLLHTRPRGVLSKCLLIITSRQVIRMSHRSLRRVRWQCSYHSQRGREDEYLSSNNDSDFICYFVNNCTTAIGCLIERSSVESCLKLRYKRFIPSRSQWTESSRFSSHSLVSSDNNLLKEGSGCIAATASSREEASNRVRSIAASLNHESVTAIRAYLPWLKLQKRDKSVLRKRLPKRRQMNSWERDTSTRISAWRLASCLNTVKVSSAKTWPKLSLQELKKRTQQKRLKQQKEEEELGSKGEDTKPAIRIPELDPPAKSERNLNDSQLKSLTLAKLKTLLQYKKLRKDGQCPKDKPGLIKMLRDTWNRSSPNPSPVPMLQFGRRGRGRRWRRRMKRITITPPHLNEETMITTRTEFGACPHFFHVYFYVDSTKL